MKYYVTGSKLSLALPAWIGTSNDHNLASNAVHYINLTLLRRGYSVKSVEMDGSWSRASQTSEELGFPQQMIAMIHIYFGGAMVAAKTVLDAISIAEDAVMEWGLTAPAHIWNTLPVPEWCDLGDEELTVEDLMNLLD